MNTLSTSRAKRVFRIATLIVPSWLAWYAAFNAPHRSELNEAVTYALGPMWMLLAAALAIRTAAVAFGSEDAKKRKNRETGSASNLARIDVLTASGSALAWSSAAAIVGAVWVGWASLAAVGLLGTGVFHLVVLWAFVSLRSHPLGVGSSRVTVERKLTPEVVTEGDDVTEEIRFEGLRIPLGFRAFVSSRVGSRWPTSRHVLEATDGGEVLLESEIGPAIRGEHEAEPVYVWFEDTFGLCRSVRTEVGRMAFTVMPKLAPVESAPPLVDHGIGPRTPKQSRRLPTEGAFDLREYRPGDDVRRIHWMRSVQAGELVVRMPDELPPDRPRVRLVLDTFFPEAFVLDCDAPSELLDSVVGVWLGVAAALAEKGMRVTLVTAAPEGADGNRVVELKQEYMTRAPANALRFGAKVAWQNRMPAVELLGDSRESRATYVVAHALNTIPPAETHARWILVPPTPRTELTPPFTAGGARLPYPAGSPENRWLARRRIFDAFIRERGDHARAVVAMRNNVATPPPGSFAAMKNAQGIVSLKAIS